MCDTVTSHICLLCMGSNLDALLHLKNAEDTLQRLFPDIEWGEIVETVFFQAEDGIRDIDS